MKQILQDAEFESCHFSNSSDVPGTLISTVGALFNHYLHLVVQMHTLWLREVAIWPVVTQFPKVTEMNQGTREAPGERVLDPHNVLSWS